MIAEQRLRFQVKVSRVIIVATAVAGCVFGLGWSAITAPDRLAVRTKLAIDNQKWDELYEITKNPRGMVSPWSKATFVSFCQRYLGSHVRVHLKALPDQGTVNFSKIWVVLLSTQSSFRDEEVVVFLDPVGARWNRDMSFFTNRWNLEAAIGQEQLLHLAASLKYPKATDGEMATYEFLVSEKSALLGMGMTAAKTVRPGTTPFSLTDHISSTRADLVQFGRKSELLKIEARSSEGQSANPSGKK
jgi:hypothetical protein